MDKQEISNLTCFLGIYVQPCLATGQFMGSGSVCLEFRVKLTVHLRTHTRVMSRVKGQRAGAGDREGAVTATAMILCCISNCLMETELTMTTSFIQICD